MNRIPKAIASSTIQTTDIVRHSDKLKDTLPPTHEAYWQSAQHHLVEPLLLKLSTIYKVLVVEPR